MTATLSPQDAATQIRAGAVLVDIREPDEYQREHIDGALLLPLSQLQGAGGTERIPTGVTLIFHCHSGVRTRALHDWMAQYTKDTGHSCYVLEGGIQSWKAAGLPVQTGVVCRTGLDIMRQVQIVAGTLVLTGVGLGYLVSPGFYGLAAFVGAGLLFAGISGFCALARLLMLMPWNRIKP